MSAAAQSNDVWVGRFAALLAIHLPRIQPKDVRKDLTRSLDELLSEPGRGELRQVIENYRR